ncbi:egg cell-secreted protein 1.4-like [Diospyros lotus]|uniref:egg cell-secreted protein 1.4-like n=1 Tax=Diospyros lotus TaxID=55363 RepID=UPI00224D87F7|nr:egg cell-secreted protein 1.4-like [Diospyros lotus]
MALNKGTLFLVAIIMCFAANSTAAAAARDLPVQPAAVLGFNLTARLETDGGLMGCWNAMAEIKSCSNEIVLFFINGETDIGPACCQAISMITHHCWPAMLTALGFTLEEGDVLRGYCDASSGPAPSPSAASTSTVVAV